MYRISDQQIEFILGDIRARGVELVSLQADLLDHVCCIIERELEDNGDFGQFYNATIRRFYKDELREIEEETISLLTNKNYYVMKKVMIYSGAFAATTLTAGIILKYMHAQGASLLIMLGILSVSLIFLPLLFALKVKEKQSGKDRLLVGLGTLSGIAIAMGILFKIMHWPGANVMSLTSPIVLMLLFLPIYFITGIRNPDTKVNTIVTSILMVVGCGLFFSLTITPATSRLMDVRSTRQYLTSERILQAERELAKTDTANTRSTAEQTQVIYALCEEIKTAMVQGVTGSKQISPDFEQRNEVLKDQSAHDYFANNPWVVERLAALRKAVATYNASAGAVHSQPIPVSMNVLDENNNPPPGYRIATALNDLIQIQMLVLQNQRALAML